MHRAYTLTSSTKDAALSPIAAGYRRNMPSHSATDSQADAERTRIGSALTGSGSPAADANAASQSKAPPAVVDLLVLAVGDDTTQRLVAMG